MAQKRMHKKTNRLANDLSSNLAINLKSDSLSGDSLTYKAFANKLRMNKGLENDRPLKTPNQKPSQQMSSDIDWGQVERDRAMQDALFAKLGSYRTTRAIYLVTNEILQKWRGIGNEESAQVIQRAVLEVLCLKNEIDFDTYIDIHIDI